jgi:hypothetical protein
MPVMKYVLWVQPSVKPGLYSLRQDIIHYMSRSNPEWYLFLVAIFIIAAIVINELGYGVLSLPLLIPIVWLMRKASEKEKPSE